jgi:hypothetical protein
VFLKKRTDAKKNETAIATKKTVAKNTQVKK